MNTDEQKILVSTISQRLYESSKYWNDCLVNYHDHRDFVTSLNALIQSLRNITFILQSNKDIIPSFDTWYLEKQNIMRNDILLRWLHDARNTIVKQSNLSIKSQICTSLVNWETFPVEYTIQNPLSNDVEIRNTILALIPRKILVKKMRDPLVRVERSWISDNLPEKELLSLTAYCYRFLKNLIVEVFVMIGEDKSGIDKEKNDKILNEVESFENSRIRIFKLKDLSSYHVETKTLKTKDLEQEVSSRYGKIMVKRSDYEKTFYGEVDFLSEMAKRMVINDGHHVPMAFFWYEDKPLEINTFVIGDTSEKYYMFRKLADMVVEKKADGLIVIGESWIKTPDYKKNIGECLLVSAVKRDCFELRQYFFTRSEKEISFTDYKITENRDSSPFLSPVFEVLK